MPQQYDLSDSSQLQPRRAADDLFSKFEDMILSGELQDGDTLPPEREIVEQFGVSRTVAREAILALSNRGLVDARPRFRPVVRRPDFDTAIGTVDNLIKQLLDQPQGVKNLFDTRAMVEAALCRQAAKEANREHLADMKSALEANGAAIDDSQDFFKTDIQFHAVLYRIPDNPILPSIHKAYTTWLEPHWSKMPRFPDRNEINYRSHTAIYEAILMRDPDAAEIALRAHLKDAWEQVHKTFEAEATEAG